MTLVQLVPVVLQISIGLIVFSLALRASPGDLTNLLRRPGLLMRSVLAMNVVMPILAAAIAALFKLRPGVEVALILLAVSPVPPVLPGKQGKAGGDVSYAIGLLVVSAVLAIVLVPLSVSLIGRVFGLSLAVPVATIGKVVGLSVLGPLVLGAIVKRLVPVFAERAAMPLSKVGTVLLVLAFLPVLLGMWKAIVGQIGDFSLVAIVLFVLVSLAVGHALGGPAPEDRTVLGLSTASRHPGVAMAIASAVVQPDNRPLVSAAVLLAVLVGSVVTVPYVKWRKRTQAAAVASPTG